MKAPTKEQQRALVRIWDTAGPELERIRREELRGKPYCWKDVDTLLDVADHYDGPPRQTSGLVEMQRLFMKAARKQGRLPYAVRETPNGYSVCEASGAGVPPANTNDAAGTAAPPRTKACQRPAPHLYVVGDIAILDRPKIALFCSVKCPGKLILKTYDLAKRLRNEGVLVISPFHSPMEQECLRILLRSPNPVIWCLARGLHKRIPSEPVDCRPAVDGGRLVMATSFPDSVRHITTDTAMIRNRLIVKMSSAVVVAHAAPASKMEILCREILAAGKSLYTFDHPANADLIQAGAQVITPEMWSCTNA